MSPVRVSAVVVTRNNRRDIIACLASLQASDRPPDEVIVVDNASSDGTADLVRREFPGVIVLDFWDNPGFGEGNNRGIRVASGDLMFLLNPDAIVERRCISELIAVLTADARCAMVVPKTVLMQEPSIINSVGLAMNQIGYGWDRGYLEWDSGQFDRQEPVLGGSGCALLIRGDAMRALGGFDAPYFLYYEDLDLCLRTWLAGHTIVFVPSAVVRHDMKVHARPVVYGDYLDHRNRLRTLLKTLSRRSLVRLAPMLVGFELKSLRDLIRRRQFAAARRRTAAGLWNILHLPSTLRLRSRVQRMRAIDDAVLAPMITPGHGFPRIRAALPTYAPVFRTSVDRSALGPSVTMGDNDVGALGLGWHGAEAMDGHPFRWSCGYGILYLCVPGPWSSGTLRIRWRSPRPMDATVRVNDQAAKTFTLTGTTWEEHDIPVSADGDNVIRVVVLPGSVLVPGEENPGSPDFRALGVAVSSVVSISDGPFPPA